MKRVNRVWMLASTALFPAVIGSPAAANLPPCGRPLFPAPVIMQDEKAPPSHGDLNNDGREDLIVPAYVDRAVKIAILFGRGDGTFEDPVTPIDGRQSDIEAVVDLDADDDLDLIVSYMDYDPIVTWIRILLNDGEGAFSDHGLHAFETFLWGLAASDLSGDGVVDLAVVTAAQHDPIGRLMVLLGQGDGTFADPVQHPFAFRPYRISAGDLDNDGDNDLAVTVRRLETRKPAVVALLNHGDGTFADPLITPLESRTNGKFSLGDFDGDGIIDVAVTALLDHCVEVLHGRGDGSFSDSAVFPVPGPLCIAMEDLDADGDPDLLFGVDDPELFGDTYYISVLVNPGDGVFEPAVNYPIGQWADGLTIADFTGDDHVDLAVRSQHGNCIPLLIGHGDGTFLAGLHHEDFYWPRTVLGDMNGDGRLDVVSANRAGCRVSVALSLGDGTLGESIVAPTGADMRSAAVGDLDGDGDLDVVAADDDNARILILLNNGDGTLGAPTDLSTPERVSMITIADFSGDGVADIALTLWSIDTLAILMGLGDVQYAEPVLYDTGDIPASMAAVDLDGDDDLDLAVAASGDRAICILRNNGEGWFERYVPYSCGFVQAWYVTAGDLDHDGDPDLAVTHGGYGDSDVVVLRNAGDGTFGPPAVFDDGEDAIGISIGDVDLDGHPDLVYGPRDEPMFHVRLGLGNGDFSEPMTFSGSGTSAAQLADLNDDGALDVVQASWYGIATFVNQSCPQGDLNGDGLVSIEDLLMLIDRWGPCPEPPTPCAPDFDADGIVGVADLLTLLGRWT